MPTPETKPATVGASRDLEVHFVTENSIFTKDSRSEEVQGRPADESNLWPSFASVSYLNTAGENGERIIVPDPEFCPMVTKLFQ